MIQNAAIQDAATKNAVIQLVHTLSYGDAISGEVLAIKKVLQAAGRTSEIYALNVHPSLGGVAFKIDAFPADFKGTVILHYSLGSPLNALYSSLKGAKRVLVFHNLTPAHWFEGINPRIVADIEAGWTELPGLCKLSDLLLADSEFNAQELRRLGFASAVLELPIDFEKWQVPPNPGIAAMLKAEPKLHVVHTGRLAPNKCIEDIIKVFYFLHHKINRQSRLWLVGIDIDTELYAFGLRRLVDELALTEAVSFVGCLADAELKALYQGAAVYLCMSEHEGFCVPLIEAMHFSLPVVAYAATAVPGTLGGGGLLLKEKRHPEIAEIIEEIYRNQTLRQQLISVGQARVSHFSMERFAQELKRLLAL